MQAPLDQDIRDWCRACGAEEQIPDLIATARAVESAYLEFRRQARAGMKRSWVHTLPLYERTTLFRIYEHNVTPGLFQTAATAQPCCRSGLASLTRRTILTLRSRPGWSGKVSSTAPASGSKSCWRNRHCGPGSAPPRSRPGTGPAAGGDVGTDGSLGIIPMMAERTAVASAGFWVFDDSLVALETPTASIEVTRPQEIDLYTRMFEHLKASACYGAAARALIIRTWAN